MFLDIFSIFAVLIVVGYLLAQSVKKETVRRQENSKLAESLEQANIRLQELDKQKTDFLLIASHQLRSPLSTFKGYIELIKAGVYGKVENGVIKVLEDMDENNEHLVKLVDEFLDITLIEQGIIKFNLIKACYSWLKIRSDSSIDIINSRIYFPLTTVIL